MKLETIKTQTTETYLAAKDYSVTVTPWGNQEGANVMMTTNSKDCVLKMAASLRWEEIDGLMAALAVARAEP